MCLKLNNHVYSLNKKRTFLTFILTKHDVITSMASNYDYDVIDIMTFCNCNVIVTRLICMFITRVYYDFYCTTV